MMLFLREGVGVRLRVIFERGSWRQNKISSVAILSPTPRSSLEKRHVEKWLAFSIPKMKFFFFEHKKQVSM